VRFGPDLAVKASEPVRADVFPATNGVPYVVRGLTCSPSSGSCAALADGGDQGVASSVAFVSLVTRSNPWQAAGWGDPEDTPPHATSIAAVADGDHLARVASAELPGGSGTLAAWVTYFLDQPPAEPVKKPEKEPPTKTIEIGPKSKKPEKSEKKSKSKSKEPATLPPKSGGEAEARLGMRSIAPNGSLCAVQDV